MEIVVHTMAYSREERVQSRLRVRHYADRDFDAYQKTYNECFSAMRTALQRFPIDCCDSRENLEKKRDQIFVLEIDDLIVAKAFQRKGHGRALLRFAVSRLQGMGISPIVLHVADWNQGAIRMYLKNGFSIVKTEIVG